MQERLERAPAPTPTPTLPRARAIRPGGPTRILDIGRAGSRASGQAALRQEGDGADRPGIPVEVRGRDGGGGGGEGSFDESHFLFADDLDGDFGGTFTGIGCGSGGGGRGGGGHGGVGEVADGRWNTASDGGGSGVGGNLVNRDIA